MASDEYSEVGTVGPDVHGRRWEQHGDGHIDSLGYNDKGELVRLDLQCGDTFKIQLFGLYGRGGIPRDGIEEMCGKRLRVSLSIEEKENDER